jgi:hypothetical protein
MEILQVYGKYIHDTYIYKPYSVGVICFTIDPGNQNIYLILGQESDFNHLIDGSTGSWCDFGGKPMDGESLTETAAREFSEESLNIVRFDKSFKCPPHYNEYKQVFRECLDSGDYVMCIRFFWGMVLRVYFLKEVPWQPEIVEHFDNSRNNFMKIIKTGQCPFSLRNHPAITFGPSMRPQISGTYLEKYKVCFWSLDRLKYVVNNHGRYRGQKFRSSFVPVVKFLIRYFKKYYL